MWFIVFDSFLAGTFCSTVASYKNNKQKTCLDVLPSQLFFFCFLPTQSKKFRLYLKGLFSI